ncbi:MAG: ThiF family adenylyltransferase [Thermodesulfobacteriota bacterium]
MALRENLKRLAREARQSNGSAYRSLACADVASLAATHGLAPWEVEAAALDAGVVPERYARNLGAVGMAGQARLLRSCAAMVGLGGLGGTVLETLARMGVGRLRGADGDLFEESNLNRQALCRMDALGCAKATAAAEAVAAVNPSVGFEERTRFLDRDGMAELFSGADLALDCLGGLASRPALRDAARAAGLPLVSAAVAGWTGWVSTVLPGGPSPVDALGNRSGVEESLGCPGPAVHAAAALQCAEAVRLLAGQPPALANRMLLFDLADMSFETIDLT